MFPVGLEVGRGDEAELGFLVFAVFEADAAAARDAVDDGDISLEGEGGVEELAGEGFVGVFLIGGGVVRVGFGIRYRVGGGGRQEDSDLIVLTVGQVVGHVDKTLASHAPPGMIAGGDAFRSRSSPEEGVLLLFVVRIGKAGLVGIAAMLATGFARSINGFVHVVPGGWIQDVVEPVCLGLGKYWHKLV